MVGGGIDDWKFFLFVGVADGWIFFWLVVLTVVGSEFAIDGGDGLRRI